jgi:heavy metal efflux system protein
VRQARERLGTDSQEAILDAVSQRLRPVLMTAMLASLGLLPAALSHAIGSDTQRPFAIVIIGGLISSTILTMLLLPTLYELFDNWFGRNRTKGAEAAVDPS